MRYPGGSYGDGYHWQTNTVSGGGYVAPGTDFDSFMGTVEGGRRAGDPDRELRHRHHRRKRPTGSSTPTSPRATATSTGRSATRYYGNGYYGADWEPDYHASKSPATYAANVVQYAQAMKAVDPTDQDRRRADAAGQLARRRRRRRRQRRLEPDGPADRRACASTSRSCTTTRTTPPRPTSSSRPGCSPPNWPSCASRSTEYAGANASHIGIAVTETQSNYQVDEDTQPGALFTADAVLHRAGERRVHRRLLGHPQRHADAITTAPDGATDYGDGGVLSSGNCNSDNVCEPPLNTPFPPYYGSRCSARSAAPGDTLVKAGSDNAAAVACTRPATPTAA